MQLEPYNAYVCHALSNLEKRQRNYERAKEILEEVVHVKPTSALCVSLAELERQLGSPENAKKVLLHGLQNCDTERSKLYLSLAWLEEDAFKNQKEAACLISEALKIDRNNIRVYIAKASMELRLSRKDEARKTLSHALTLQSEDGQHYTMLGTLELELGNFDEAAKILEEGSKLYPGDQFLLQRWGTIEAKIGNIEKARKLFEKSVIIQPHAPTFVAWAILEEKEGLKAVRSKIIPSESSDATKIDHNIESN
jgi:tetratricopeptide (TPR) repeat protein